MIPGIDEIFALIDVKTHVESGAYDVVIVDCAPTAETLRLLSLPDIMNWYIERIFPVQRRLVRVVRPLVSRTTNLPIAGDKVFAAVERLHHNLEAVRQILADEAMSSVRLVVNPEKMVIAEARRTYTYLGLFGYRVDAVIVNRILPERRDRPVLRQVEGHPGRAPRDRARVVRARADPRGAAVRPRDGRRRGCSPRWPTRSTGARGDRRPVPSTIRSGCGSEGTATCCRMRLPFVSRRRPRRAPARRGVVRARRALQAEPAAATDPQAHGCPRGQPRGEHLEIVFERAPEPARGELKA